MNLNKISIIFLLLLIKSFFSKGTNFDYGVFFNCGSSKGDIQYEALDKDDESSQIFCDELNNIPKLDTKKEELSSNINFGGYFSFDLNDKSLVFLKTYLGYGFWKNNSKNLFLVSNSGIVFGFSLFFVITDSFTLEFGPEFRFGFFPKIEMVGKTFLDKNKDDFYKKISNKSKIAYLEYKKFIKNNQNCLSSFDFSPKASFMYSIKNIFFVGLTVNYWLINQIDEEKSKENSKKYDLPFYLKLRNKFSGALSLELNIAHFFK
jgi:hypothetical protein